MTILEAIDIGVERGGERVLDGVSLTVEAGDSTLIQGRSGAGKTTLFEILGLLDVPDEGEIRIAGEPTTSAGHRERARVRREAVGTVFQDFQLVPDLTAWENARLPMEHTGDVNETRLAALFETLGIEALHERTPASISGGEKQRVAIARALANDPQIVLADEPTGQLDHETGKRVRELLLEATNKRDVALIVISHESSWTKVTNQTYVLAEGELSRADATSLAEPS